MNTQNKRLICVFLTVAMVISLFVPAVHAEDSVMELSGDTIERVYEEILTGDITNEEDVLKVALAQYSDKLQSGMVTCGARTMSPVDGEENTTPIISQVLEACKEVLDRE